MGFGLRGCRVGEAQNPGPQFHNSTASIKIWSHNISSFQANAETLLKQADDNGVCVVVLQETKGSVPGQELCQEMGWDLHLLQQPGSRKGGVAVLVKEPIGLAVLDSVSSPQFQLFKVSICGTSTPLTLVCGYRVPDEDDGFTQALEAAAQDS